MKRSEMIEKIYKKLYKLYPECSDHDGYAEELLELVEDHGMLPPEIYDDCSNPVVYLKIDSPDAGFVMPTHFISGWEDE